MVCPRTASCASGMVSSGSGGERRTICRDQSATPSASRWSVPNIQVEVVLAQNSGHVAQALMVVPCKMQGLHMPPVS